MDLKTALKAVAPAVGDGKIIPEHAYALFKDGVLQVTDGNQWASARVEGSGLREFCVRFDGLSRAMERDAPRMTFERQDVKVTYQPRGWAKLKGLADRSVYPVAPIPRDAGTEYRLPMAFKRWCADLVPFTGDKDGQVWTQGVHIGPDFMLAGTGIALIRTRESINVANFIPLPAWAARFIAAQDEPPMLLHDFRNLAKLVWEDGLTLTTRLLDGELSEPVVELAHNCRIPTVPVPEGLKDAVARLKEHGATTLKAGQGKVTHHSDAVDVEEEVTVAGPIKTWSVGTLQAALEHATHLDLSEEHAFWASEQYVGIVAGMRG